MSNKNISAAKSKVFVYWITTGFLCLGMIGGGIAQLMHAKPNVEGMLHLGYPLYLLNLLGIWKIAGAIAILVPGFLLVKEWAYAGLFFAMTGAVVSHIASGDAVQLWIASFVFAMLVVISWYSRPDNRKLNVSKM